MKEISGVLTALITPFKGGEIDLASLRQLVRFQTDRGVAGFVIAGTTGESPCLTIGETRLLFETVRDESGGNVPLIVGTGSNSTDRTIETTRTVAQWGADAALVVVPYYNKPSQRGLLEHYRAVANSNQLPIILYNVPSRTITKLELETIVELSRESNIIGIKEATGDLNFAKQILASCQSGFSLLSGDDGTFPALMELGGSGVISVASHILPREFVKWSHQRTHGEASPEANDFFKYRDVINALYVEANPIPVKMALFLMGLIASPELRLPLTTLGDIQTIELKQKMQTAGLL